MKINKKYIYISFPIILLIIFSLFLFFKKGDKTNIDLEKQMKYNKLIKPYVIKETELTESLEITGVIEPIERHSINSAQNGEIDKVFVERGQYVKRGDPIILLDRDSTLLQLYQNEKDMKTAQISGTKQDIKIYEQQNKIYQKNYENALIKAPISGYLASFDFKKGDFVSSGNQIGEIFNTTSYISEISVNEIDVETIKIGDIVSVSFTALPDTSFKGIVNKIFLDYRETNGVVYYPIQIKFNKNTNQLKPGYSFTGEIEYKIGESDIYIPKTSIKIENGKYFVMKINKEKITKQYVKLKFISSQYYKVISGLKIGDTISTINMGTGTKDYDKGIFMKKPGVGKPPAPKGGK